MNPGTSILTGRPLLLANENTVGGKAFNLVSLQREGFQVPPFLFFQQNL